MTDHANVNDDADAAAAAEPNNNAIGNQLPVPPAAAVTASNVLATPPRPPSSSSSTAAVAAAAASLRHAPNNSIPPLNHGGLPKTSRTSTTTGGGDDMSMSSIGSAGSASAAAVGEIYIRESDGKKVRRVKRRRRRKGNNNNNTVNTHENDDDTTMTMGSFGTMGSSLSIVGGADGTTTTASMMCSAASKDRDSNMYIRASDGKRVRRVKRSHKKQRAKQQNAAAAKRGAKEEEEEQSKDNDIPRQVSITSPTKTAMDDGPFTSRSAQSSVEDDSDNNQMANVTNYTETISRTKEEERAAAAAWSKTIIESQRHGTTQLAVSTSSTNEELLKATQRALDGLVVSTTRTATEKSSGPATTSTQDDLCTNMDIANAKPTATSAAINPWLMEPTDLEGIEGEQELTHNDCKNLDASASRSDFVVPQPDNDVSALPPEPLVPPLPDADTNAILGAGADEHAMPGEPEMKLQQQQAVDSSTSENSDVPDRYQLDPSTTRLEDSPSPVDYTTAAIGAMGVATTVFAVQTANAASALPTTSQAPPPITTVEFVAQETRTTGEPTNTTAVAPFPISSVESCGCASLDAYPSEDAISPKAAQNDEDVDELQGGRLWRAAARMASHSSTTNTPKRRQLPEPIMARTRSRADVDAFVTPPRTPISPTSPSRGAHLVRLNDDDNAFILHTAFARKRVKVVQLLIFGLIGLSFGFLGSFYVQSSCHFLTATVEVGDNTGELDLHYGMWKYTPLSSAIEGYSNCYKYDGQYTTDSPVAPRIFGLVALVLGIYTLAVLWVYLVVGRTDLSNWNRAIYASGASGIFQALTMVFFAGNMCLRYSCSIGPGAAVSIVSTLTWFVLAFELHYNSPVSVHGGAHDDDITGSPDGIVATLEMSDVGDGMTAFFRRITNASSEGIPTLNQYRRDKRKSPARGGGTYEPPEFVHA